MDVTFGTALVALGLMVVAQSGRLSRWLRHQRWPFFEIPVFRVVNPLMQSRFYVIIFGSSLVICGILALQ